MHSKGTLFMRRIPRFRHFPFRMVLMLVCLACFSLPGRAQTGVYATFDASNYHVPNVGWQYGPTFGLYHDFGHLPLIAGGLDVRGTFLGSGSETVDMGYLGPRLALHPHVIPIMPYVEGLVGGGHVNIGQGVANTNKIALAYEGVVGADWTIFPRVDWRVVEYSFGGTTVRGLGLKPSTLSTGLVVRLP